MAAQARSELTVPGMYPHIVTPERRLRPCSRPWRPMAGYSTFDIRATGLPSAELSEA